jgi:hypothetical protein
MLMSDEFVRAEDRYRREILQDQNQVMPRSRGKRTIAGLALAGAIVLAACGAPAEADTAAVAPAIPTPSAILTDPGPTWEPNLKAVQETLTAPRVEFGGMAAPSWQPNRTVLEQVLSEPETGTLNNSEPFGYPNYGRLESYLGSQPRSGIR